MNAASPRRAAAAPHLAQRLAETLRRGGALRRGERFLVAASGGLDSTVLARLMASLAPRWHLTVTLAYIHHGLRAEADEEQRAVAALATSLGFGFAARRIACGRRRGESLQATARALRYAALEECRAEAGAAWILTAHHADDQAETVLLRFLRGSASAGLAGILPRAGAVLRPLLSTTRAELEAYARAHSIAYCRDSSNERDEYARNALRRHVMPAIRAHVHPSAPDVLCRAAEHHRALQEYLVAQRAAWERGVLTAARGAVRLAVQPLAGYLDFQQRMVIQHAIELAVPGAAGDRGIRRVQDLLRRQAGARVTLRGACTAERTSDAIVIRAGARAEGTTAAAKGGDASAYRIPVALGAVAAAGDGVFASRRVDRRELRLTADPASEYIDLAAAGTSWVLRSWRRGDAFQPLGARGRKKVSDLFTERKVPRGRRPSIPILERDGDIIWICGMRLDRRFRVTARSGDIALISYHETDTTP